MKIEAVGLRRIQLVMLLTAITAIGGLATNIYVPSLPDLTREMGTTQAMAQNTLSAYFAGVAFAQLFYGPLSDRYGRRPVLLGGLILFAVASAICAVSPNIEALIWGRFAQAAGACVGQVVVRAVVRDLFDRNETASMMASIMLAIAIAPAAAPVLGALIHNAAGWRMNFYVVAGFALLVLVLARRYLPETLKPEHRIATGIGTMLAGYRTVLTSPVYLGYSVCSTFIFAMLFSFQSKIPFLLIDGLGYSEVEFALIGMLPVVGFVAGSWSAGRFTPRLGIERMITLGMAVTLFGAGLMVALAVALPLSAITIMSPMTFVVLGMGMVFPNASAIALSEHPEIAGTASAMLGFMQMAGGGAAVAVVAVISKESHLPLAWAMLAFAVISSLAPVIGNRMGARKNQRVKPGQAN